MGFRSHKSLRILPGVRLNVSKSGFSASLGPRGANVNVGPRGRRFTLGLPGSGISHVKQAAWRRTGTTRRRPGRTMAVLAAVVFVLLLIFRS